MMSAPSWSSAIWRVVLVPSGRKVAERVKANGGTIANTTAGANIVDGTNIVKDPDGYVIELYQRPAPPARWGAGLYSQVTTALFSCNSSAKDKS